MLPATYRTSGVDCKIAPGLRVGYVTGTGDAVPQSLASIGVKSEFLSPEDLAQGDLQKYDVIVLGVRAYAARPELATNNQRLLDYVKNGGVLIVQYNTTGQYDRDFLALIPIACRAPRERQELWTKTSPVSFLDPKSPVLSWPNQIGEQDFAGWFEERGHGFLASWDSTIRRRWRPMIRSRTRKKAAWYTRHTAAEFMSMSRWRSIASCQMVCREPIDCLQTC